MDLLPYSKVSRNLASQYFTHSSPKKSKFTPTFPPPASPPPFAISGYSTTPAHIFAKTTRDTTLNPKPVAARSTRTFPSLTRALSSPTLSLPSAAPLDDDPFLVLESTDNSEGHNLSHFGPKGNDPARLPDHMKQTSSNSEDATLEAGLPSTSQPMHTVEALNGLRYSVRRAQTVSGAKLGVTKKSNHKPMAHPQSRKTRASSDSKSLTSIASLPSSLFSSTSRILSSPRSPFPPRSVDCNFSLAVNQAAVSRGATTASAGDLVSGHEHANTYSPQTLSYNSDTSHQFSGRAGGYACTANPSTTYRSMFPTPSLTASFSTPSVSSPITTPASTVLFPSPHIFTSPYTPLVSSSHSARGRVQSKDGRIVARPVTPTLDRVTLAARDSIVDIESAELVHDRQNKPDQCDRSKAESSSAVQGDAVDDALENFQALYKTGANYIWYDRSTPILDESGSISGMIVETDQGDTQLTHQGLFSFVGTR
jgi:hypothetical protein